MKEIKDSFKNIDKGLREMDEIFIEIKTNIHTLDKLGMNVDELFKQIDNVGIELYKMKEKNLNKFKEIYNK